jgi:hypothetical protein
MDKKSGIKAGFEVSVENIKLPRRIGEVKGLNGPDPWLNKGVIWRVSIWKIGTAHPGGMVQPIPTNVMRLEMKRTIPQLPLALALATALSGCGTSPGPDLSGPNGASYTNAFSGDWVLLRLDSDDMEGMMRERMGTGPADRGGATGSMPGAAGRGGGASGGRPPGGMTGGRAGVLGQGMQGQAEELERVRRGVQLLSRTQGEFTLTLRPESVTLVQGEDPPIVMALGKAEVQVLQREVEFFAGAKWTSDGLVIERVVDGGAGVKDKIHVDEEGHLIVEREIDTGRRRIEGVLKYRRADR